MTQLVPNGLPNIKVLRVYCDSKGEYQYALLPIIAWDIDEDRQFADAITPFGDEDALAAEGDSRVEVIDATSEAAVQAAVRREWANLAASK